MQQKDEPIGVGSSLCRCVNPVVWTRPTSWPGALSIPWCAFSVLAGCAADRSGIFTVDDDACVPRTCSELGVECGPVNDGCGGFLDCGGCGERSSCVDNSCECHPLECGKPGTECGKANDGCGGLLECGDTCTNPEVCGGEVPNTCGCPDACDAVDRPKCGAYWDTCRLETMECGRGCTRRKTCVDRACDELSADGVVINEFSWQFDYAELLGPPRLELEEHYILGIEGDSNTDRGRVRFVVALGDEESMAPATLDERGYLTVTLHAGPHGNGTITLVLVSDYTGTTDGTTDVDYYNNGSTNVALWSKVLDGIAVHDGGLGDNTYAGVPVLTPSLTGWNYPVGGASRIPNGIDTDTPNDWARNDPDGFGIADDAEPPSAGLAINTPAWTPQSGYNVSVE